ncbi:hypothetical protein [Sporosarcina sp. ZBG7A]|uniref:hypothetical protein n=1 Tax=Sporosarcina sp. ZBG7A TaxID=1582223 RepID=UPI0012E017F3|nr:hypothetical protein [Sporosarcina sp. ZBG7A]
MPMPINSPIMPILGSKVPIPLAVVPIHATNLPILVGIEPIPLSRQATVLKQAKRPQKIP